jgi:SAM-dependent methyltransferase
MDGHGDSSRSPAPHAEPGALKDFYENRYSGEYMAIHPDAWIVHVRDVLVGIEASEIRTILDYGCGRGFWTSLLHGMFPSAEIVGIDISETAIEHAASEQLSATFLSFDGRRAPFADSSFDLVFSFHVLEHVLDLPETLDDITRLVARNGRLCLVLPCGNDGSFEHAMAERTQGIVSSSTGELRFRFEDEAHLRRLKSRDLVEELSSRGLVLESAWFANQFWGALEFMVRSDVSFIRRFADPRLAPGLVDAAYVAAVRFLLILLALTVRAYRVGTQGTTPAKRGRAAVARVLRAGAPLLAPPVTLLGRRAEREWRTRSEDPRGSAQYLVLRRH